MSKPHLKYLITGAARGIGRYLARSLCAKGHSVFLIDNDAEELAHTATVMKGNFRTYVVDITDKTELKKAVEEATQFFDGELDVLVNNAMAMPHTLPAKDFEVIEDSYIAMYPGDNDEIDKHWDRQIAVALPAPFRLTRLSNGILYAAQGTVINISSTRAYMAEREHEGYSAAKAGLLGLSRALSVTMAPIGVSVNSLVLGWVYADHECKSADEQKQQWGHGLDKMDHEWHPAGRGGKPEDVLRAVEYLAASKWVTGTEMVLDGGVTRKMVYPE